MPTLSLCPDNASISGSSSGRIQASGNDSPGYRQASKNVYPLQEYDLSWKTLTRTEVLDLQTLFYSVGYFDIFDADFSTANMPSGNYRFNNDGFSITCESNNNHSVTGKVTLIRGT